MLNRLAPQSGSSPLAHGPFSSLEWRRGGTSLSLPSGEIVGELRPVALAPGRSATYRLTVANGTPLPLATFAYAARQPDGARVCWNSAMVPPDSSLSIPIEIPIRSRSWPERVIAELHTSSAHLTIDAGPPPGRGPGPALIQCAAASLAALLVLLATIGYLSARPRVVALAAPDAVEGGKAFSVAYALTGAANARYAIDSPDGKEVAHGLLAAKDGSFSIALPAGAVAKGYDVHVSAHSALGVDSRAAHVVALSVPREDVKIAASLLRGEVKSGDQVVVNYRTSATDGSVELVDQLGAVRAETLLNAGGSSILIAPAVDRTQDYRVLVRATRGGTTREKRLSVRIEPQAPAPAVALGNALVPAIDRIPPPLAPAPAPTVLPTAAAPSVTLAGAPADSNAQIVTIPQLSTPVREPFALTSDRVASGATFAVTILRNERAMHVALMDLTGGEISGVEVGAQQQTARLTAPHVAKPNKYLVVATFKDGYGQETVVRPITVGTR